MGEVGSVDHMNDYVLLVDGSELQVLVHFLLQFISSSGWAYSTAGQKLFVCLY